MKKAFIRSICLICALIMASLTLFACNDNTDNTEDKAPSNVHTVKFNSNGGTYISDVEVRDGQKISEPPAPTRENYIFLNWEKEHRTWVFGAMAVTEDITLNAIWISAAELFDIVPTENADELLISGFAKQKSIYHLTIPEKINGKTVVGFTENAFKSIHEEHADHLTVPATVRTVGDSAFQSITQVHINFLGEISEIGVSSFEGCTKLETLNLGTGLKSIPYRCFFGATSLAALDIPEGVTVIEENAFSSCTSMQTIVLPSSLTTVEDGAFLDSSELAVVFFKGTEEQFDAIEISNNNNELLSAKIYFYSDTQPTESGDFWHYDKSNTPILWQ